MQSTSSGTFRFVNESLSNSKANLESFSLKDKMKARISIQSPTVTYKYKSLEYNMSHFYHFDHKHHFELITRSTLKSNSKDTHAIASLEHVIGNKIIQFNSLRCFYRNPVRDIAFSIAQSMNKKKSSTLQLSFIEEVRENEPRVRIGALAEWKKKKSKPSVSFGFAIETKLLSLSYKNTDLLKNTAVLRFCPINSIGFNLSFSQDFSSGEFHSSAPTFPFGISVSADVS
eukprot:TRINITY_DN125_c0_g1_i17.p1 TRINITY_DN125_c0_g1~~TRINITY_DN125_c0_g1_i17.p1  ORF type:complete len:229 (-),score=26.75 TRINITY_DN125_c0_g1_i17:23-709(-)